MDRLAPKFSGRRDDRDPPAASLALESTIEKVREAEAWSPRDPQRVALAYTSDGRWRNRVEILRGREAIR